MTVQSVLLLEVGTTPCREKVKDEDGGGRAAMERDRKVSSVLL